MPNLYLAEKTRAAIDAAIKADQGAVFRKHLQDVLPHIGDAYRQDEERHRTHMGASLLGGECGRAIWYNFRWATASNFEGRMMRLFNRGHMEEARFIAMLLTIGIKIYQQDENGKQFRISFADGHAGGSGDGVGVGFPELAPDQPALMEFKTHGEKSFIEVAGVAENTPNGRTFFGGKGVRAAKLEHYVQMQLYMHKMGLAVAMYFAVNKNTDDLYIEIIPYDRATAEQFIERGEKLVWMDTAPKRINESPGFFKCRFCDHRPVCHLKQKPDLNCRTCAYSMPTANGAWTCRKHEKVIDKKTQLSGCEDYTVSKAL
jgi:hypothetical protein